MEIEELKDAVKKAEANKNGRSSELRMELFFEHLNKNQAKRITIPTSDGLQFINVDEIIYLEASDNYTNIYLSTNQKYLVCRTLKDFEDILPADSFLTYLSLKHY